MIKYTRLFITFLLAVIVLQANAQSTATTSSPYSRFGIGDIDNQLMPQNIGMGGIATATNTIGGYNSINVINPASYGKITFTTIDAGISSDIITLSKNGYPDQRNSNFKLSHLVFAFPVTKHSALSFGLLPYSQVGYNYKQTFIRNGSKGTTGSVDTVTNSIFSGDGGLSKAYFGYGFGIGKHLLIGANVSYIFGNLKKDQSTEPLLYGTLNSRVEDENHIRGLNYDYGVQYSFDLSETKHLTLGYSASANSKLNVKNSTIVSQYTRDAFGNENIPADSLINSQTANGKLQLPQINHFGIAFQSEGKFLIGADYTTGKWSDLSIAGTNQGLQDSKMYNIGGQITPNINALSSFWALIDYRLGAIYETTNLNVSNVSIKRYAATFGLGIPLPHDRASSAFYKVNISAEVGQRGVLTQNLVKEKYINIHLGFLLNDKWFQRFKFE